MKNDDLSLAHFYGKEITAVDLWFTLPSGMKQLNVAYEIIKDGIKKELENESMRFLIAGKGIRTNMSRMQIINRIKTICYSYNKIDNWKTKFAER